MTTPPPAGPAQPGPAAPHDEGQRTTGGSNYGDYVPPRVLSHPPEPPEPCVPPDIAPDDPDYALWQARRAQRAARAAATHGVTPAPDAAASQVGEEDPGSAADESQPR
ncbi:hypothetical protein V4F39_03325 [Aquincola sp. MAHUQ-54]|uniref:Uncharacterized protein n=1 Tax=Aquincola agrisoli TaxID=3119538 RepID=A0AAW9PYS7_9BURK